MRGLDGGSRRRPGSRAAAARIASLVGLLSLAASSVAATTALPATPGHRQADTIRSPSIVEVHAAVLEDGQPLPDLTAEDFRVLEDGHAVRVVSVRRPQPDRSLLLLNASAWMRLWPAKEAIEQILDALPEDSCASLVLFGGDGSAGARGRAGDPALRAWLNGLAFDGSGAIFDALRDVYRALAREEPGAATAGLASPPDGESCDPSASGTTPSRADGVILVTFGRDEGSRAEPEEIARVTGGTGVPLYVLAAVPRFSAGDLEVRGTPSPYPTMRGLERLVEFTGGFVFRGPTYPTDELWQALQRLIATLRAHYVIAYEPPRRVAGTEPWPKRHRIRIDVVGRRGTEVVAPSHLVYPRAR